MGPFVGPAGFIRGTTISERLKCQVFSLDFFVQFPDPEKYAILSYGPALYTRKSAVQLPLQALVEKPSLLTCVVPVEAPRARDESKWSTKRPTCFLEVYRAYMSHCEYELYRGTIKGGHRGVLVV